MTISVVIPVYNGEKYIEQAIESVLLQPYKKIEIICVDDGSTDRSTEIVTEIARKQSNIKLIKKKNGGVGSARNTGPDAAEGDYVAFLDQDDIWLYAITDEVVETIIAADSDMVAFTCYCSNVKISRIRVETRPDGVYSSDFNKVPMRHHSSYFYKTSFLRSNAIYTDRFDGEDHNYRNEDTRFLIQCYAKVKKMQCISVPLFVYRNNPGSVVHQSQGERTLISSLDGFQKLADTTDDPRIRTTCNFYTTRYFLELLDNLCSRKDYLLATEQYYEKYRIEDLLRAGYASVYSKTQYKRMRENPDQFWADKRKKGRVHQVRLFLGSIPILRSLYHIKRYPIVFHDDSVRK